MDRVVDAAQALAADDVPRHAHDEQVVHALAEHHLHGDSGVGAAEDDAERPLLGAARRLPGAEVQVEMDGAGLAPARALVRLHQAGQPPVALDEALDGLRGRRGEAGGRGMLGVVAVDDLDHGLLASEGV
jgi:hypothetical protein